MNKQPVILVTGGARRVGAAIVRRLHAAGCAVAIHYRSSADEAEALAQELNATRTNSAHTFAGALENDDTPTALVDSVLTHFGRLDGLVNNASAFYPTPIGETTAAHWDDLFAANARAPFFLAQAATPALRAAHGAIVNIVDIYAERPLAGHVVYSMAKAALVMLTQALAKDLAPDVRVNAVAPGAILWPASGKPEEAAEALIAKTPLARKGEPDDVAEAVRWLLLDAHYTTGQVIRVDGGRALNI
ncbi:pteridine reductase [Luteibacter rhizovicinus DSM 16549]|uniref:Pteridine reductase n=1 Tax=Luteibacter rhizovicinus DSM 16549 TaxID=1440763 RepID=A0A0G9H0B4_9GAMM|nr:pteridine reductase [Luteibacter rhizovicinus]APG04077.1 pteridine reductase [Luteibacter rhizovicinus DSM 16549]KLD62951.1 pteridine reductase [Luteibacter rhizovicinus DSM 16549]KLD73405.1 pteridine reductase [Xanthomonas hyacinthi DSM 19077]